MGFLLTCNYFRLLSSAMQGVGQNDADPPAAETLLAERFRAAMSHAAESSLILKPLSLLSRLYNEQSTDAAPSGDIDHTEVSSFTKF